MENKPRYWTLSIFTLIKDTMNLELELEANRSKKSVNKDFYQPLNFERSSMIIPVSDIDSIVNTYEVFDNERNSATKYRLNLTLNPIMTNVLVNKLTEVISGSTILTTGTTTTRMAAIQTINDDLYSYRIGYDIFDNNFMRVDSFKTGNTLNDFTGTTLFDLLTIEDSISKNIYEDNGWVTLSNKTKINNNKMFSNKKPCEKIDLFPTRNYLLFKPIYTTSGLTDNWDYSFTYPYENYYDDILVTNEIGLNGMPISYSSFEIYNDITYLVITSVYKHGFKANDVIKIKRDDSNSGKTYLIYDIGDISKNNQDYKFMLDTSIYSDLLSVTGMTNNRLVKVVNKTDSEYYIRKFRKIPNFIDDTDKITVDNIDSKILTGNTSFLKEAYQPGFSRNIYNDSIYQLQYLDDIDINLLKDNLGRPLSEIFFTIIKKNIIDGNYDPANVFTRVTSGIDSLTGITGYTSVRLINNVTSNESPLEVNITTTGSTIFKNSTQQSNSFLGDIIEYNISTVKEIKVDDIYHRFNTVQRETTGNTFQYHKLNTDTGLFEIASIAMPTSNEGYYYKPHYSIQLKNYSRVISQGEIPKINNCEDFISGMTFSNSIVILSGETDNLIKSLVLRLDTTTGLTNFDTIRITKISDNSYLNLKITVSSNLKNSIIFPYVNSFFGSISGITINDYIIRKYSSSSIPLYCQDMYNGSCLWREILKEGIFDTESILVKENTFTNGRLYSSNFINFYLKRQDPFGDYGLRTNTFPSDLFGNSVESKIINNVVNAINTIC